jgi:hypothetical protein
MCRYFYVYQPRRFCEVDPISWTARDVKLIEGL